jgi:hypothetical protein
MTTFLEDHTVMPPFADNHASLRNWRALSVAWAVATAALLLLPGSTLPGRDLPGPLVTAIEIAVHGSLFFGLAWLANRGFVAAAGSAAGSNSQAQRRWRVLAVVLAYCVLLEIAQIPVPGRGFEVLDIAVGWLGAILGLGRRA